MKSSASPTAKFAVLLLLAVLMTGCSLFEDDSGDVTPTATLDPQNGAGPVEPGPAPGEPDPPGTVYEVQWILDDMPAVLDAIKVEFPLASVVPDVEAVWKLFVAEGVAAEPREFLTTGRLLNVPVWNPGDDSVTIPYFTSPQSNASAIGHMQI